MPRILLTPIFLGAIALAVITLSLPIGAAAQAPGNARESNSAASRYLSLDHQGYEAIAGLRHRGLLPELDPLVQPYRRADIAKGLAALDPDTLRRPVSHWVRLLQRELAPEIERARHVSPGGEPVLVAGAVAMVGGTASTSRRLDPLLPWREEGPALHGWPSYGGGIWAEVGRFAIESRLFHDLYQENSGPEEGQRGDPEGLNPGGIIVFNRTDNAYVSIEHSLGSVFVGRMRRNWGPLGADGLMISDGLATYPQIAFDLGYGRFMTRHMMGELEPMLGQQRHVVAHHIGYRTPDFGVSIGEAKVIASSGPQLRYLNPFELHFFDHPAEPFQVDVANLMLNAQVWYRRGGMLLFGEFVLDDIDVTPPPDREKEATIYAGLAGARFTSLVDWAELGIDYRQVSAWMYRVPYVVGSWSYLNRGLADDQTDYDRLTLSLSLFPPMDGLRLTPTMSFQRKGEGDFRIPIGEAADYFGAPGLFLGVKERTLRMALRGHYQPTSSIFLEWDAGVNQVADAGHERGRSRTEFSGLARFGLTWSTHRLFDH